MNTHHDLSRPHAFTNDLSRLHGSTPTTPYEPTAIRRRPSTNHGSTPTTLMISRLYADDPDEYTALRQRTSRPDSCEPTPFMTHSGTTPRQLAPRNGHRIYPSPVVVHFRPADLVQAPRPSSTRPPVHRPPVLSVASSASRPTTQHQAAVSLVHPFPSPGLERPVQAYLDTHPSGPSASCIRASPGPYIQKSASVFLLMGKRPLLVFLDFFCF
ncbi:hypothetical protein B0H16DRAFT_1488106 [Mycena metata]|uniref:Uncharacterized protein n=1 Tax=Mycena metata TaxID=1033252 RepID=A0AAD7KHK3_9AGAR|nr:hypothetical protein B0H16DRAFT_1488106 [Mycena metata]